MGWFDRRRKASAGRRVTAADKRQAQGTVAELTAITAERERLMRDGLVGVATIVGVRADVATTALGSWHELDLDVRLPDRDTYRAARRVAVELSSAPHLRVGAEVQVRIDPLDPSTVLVLARPG